MNIHYITLYHGLIKYLRSLWRHPNTVIVIRPQTSTIRPNVRIPNIKLSQGDIRRFSNVGAKQLAGAATKVEIAAVFHYIGLLVDVCSCC